MTLEVKHKKVSLRPATADSQDVDSSDWNDTHSISLTAGTLLGAHEGGDGTGEEVTLGGNLTMSSSGVLSSSGAKDFVATYGADPTGVTNSDSAWTAAVAAGGEIYVPNGIYLFDTVKTITSKNGLTFHGEGVGAGGGEGGVVFRFSTATGDCITFSNCQHSGLRNIRFKPTVRRTSGWDVKFTGGCFMCSTHDTRHEYTYNGVWVHHATETEIHHPIFRNMYGPEPFLYGRGATASEASYRCTVYNLRGDNPYSTEPDAVAHANTTAFSLGDLIRETSGFYECTTAGTSGTGTPPTAPGGTTAAEGFTTEVTDGTVGWTFRGNASLAWVTQDSYGYSLIMDKVAALNGWLGFYKRDTTAAASNASVPLFTWLWGFEADHNHLYGLALINGMNAYLSNCWVSSALDGNGIAVGPNYIGELQIDGGRVFGCAEHGILVNAGPINWRLSGITITANSQKTSATYHGITTGVNCERGRIYGCTTVRTDGGSNPQAYGLLASTGIDNVIITDNDFTGNTTGSTSGVVASSTILFNNNLT